MDISSETASSVSNWANLALIASLVVGVVATCLVVWMGQIKDQFADADRRASAERIAQVRLETKEALARVAEANEKSIATSLQLAKAETKLAELRALQAQRSLTQEQKAAIVTAISPFRGQKVRVESILGDAEGQAYRDDFVSVLDSAGWDHAGDEGISAGVFDVDPIGIEVTVHQVNAKQGRTNEAIDALLAALKKLDLFQGGGPRMNTQVADGEVSVKIGKKILPAGRPD